MFDAYTVRKVVPRLVVAVIAINLSFYLSLAAIDIASVVGEGVRQLITAPFSDADILDLEIKGNATNTVTGVLGAGILGTILALILAAPGVVGGALLAILFFLFVMGISLPLVAMAILFTIIIRQGLLIFLTIISPIAIACMLLPGTEKYFRAYLDLFAKTLIVYPIISAIFAVSNVFGAILFNAAASGQTSGATGLLQLLVGTVVLFAPLFLIPFAFKFAGGVLSRLIQFGTGTATKAGNFIKGDARDPYSLQSRARRRFGATTTRAQARFIDEAREPGATRRARFRGRAVGGFGVFNSRVDERMSRYNKEAREREEEMSSSGRDALRYAAAGYKLSAGTTVDTDGLTRYNPTTNKQESVARGTVLDKDTYFNSKGAEVSKYMYDEARKFHGGDIAGVSQGLEYTTRKAQSDKDIENMRYAMEQNATANNWTDQEVVDVWAAATFAHKDKFGSEWYALPETTKDANGRTNGLNWKDVNDDPGNYSKFIGEQHKVKESFKLSSVRDQDWRAMSYNQQIVQEALDNGGVIQSGSRAGQSLTQQDIDSYAMTDEVMEGMVHQGIVTQDGDGNVTVSGASAASANVIKSMYDNRRYATVSAIDGAGNVSANERIVYKSEAAKTLRGSTALTVPNPHKPGETVLQFTMSEDEAARANSVARAAVTGDIERSKIRK